MTMNPEVLALRLKALKIHTDELEEEFKQFELNTELAVGSIEYFNKAYELRRRVWELQGESEYLNNYLEKLKGD